VILQRIEDKDGEYLEIDEEMIVIVSKESGDKGRVLLRKTDAEALIDWLRCGLVRGDFK
jgi:hypothetical protein